MRAGESIVSTDIGMFRKICPHTIFDGFKSEVLNAIKKMKVNSTELKALSLLVRNSETDNQLIALAFYYIEAFQGEPKIFLAQSYRINMQTINKKTDNEVGLEIMQRLKLLVPYCRHHIWQLVEEKVRNLAASSIRFRLKKLKP